MTMHEQIRDVLARHGKLTRGIDEFVDGESLYSAGLTSHACVNVMLALEDEFDIEFPERMLKRSTFDSIGNLAAALGDLLEPVG